jgi:hypothetical protein
MRVRAIVLLHQIPAAQNTPEIIENCAAGIVRSVKNVDALPHRARCRLRPERARKHKLLRLNKKKKNRTTCKRQCGFLNAEESSTFWSG